MINYLPLRTVEQEIAKLRAVGMKPDAWYAYFGFFLKYSHNPYTSG